MAHEHLSTPHEQTIERLEHDAELYDQAGPGMELRPEQMLPLLITGLVFLLALASVRYTLGDVVASLTMIESPSSTAIIESKPPAYADEPNAIVEKEMLLPSEATADADVEVMVVNHKPITANLKQTMRHLHRVGGFRARWRGLGVSMIYHLAHFMLANFLSHLLGFGLLGESLCYIFTSVTLCKLHMCWTHAMIAAPSQRPWYRRDLSLPRGSALLLPSLVFAVAQQATLIMPLAVFFLIAPVGVNQEYLKEHHGDCSRMALLALRFLAVPATGLAVAFGVLLPAAVTLTRIEAAFLPESEETIVPFNRQALLSSAELVRGGRGSGTLFVTAWRSFDLAARLRLIKFYVKMIFVQLFLVNLGLLTIFTEVFVLGVGGDSLALFIKSATAQMQLAAIEAKKGN